MPDGEILRASRFRPAGDPNAPLVLIRGPYGRAGPHSLPARLLAARGYQVLHVSLRGTAGSGGKFQGFTIAADDTPATLEWMRRQPWYPGAFATWGTSYYGYSQWELASQEVPEWKAAIIQDAPSEMYHALIYSGGAFALYTALRWTDTVHGMLASESSSIPRRFRQALTAEKRVRSACDTVPTRNADLVAIGQHEDYFQEWLDHPQPDGFWDRMDHSHNVERMPPVVYLAGGWYDFFLPQMLADYGRLVRSGRDVRLLVGPWGHGRGMASPHFLRDAFTVLDHALRDGGTLPKRVRLYTTGAGGWAASPEWPPPGHESTRWYLTFDGALQRSPGPTGTPSRFRYDPRDPTPTIGGSTMGKAGPADNGDIESRSDVLTFTSVALTDTVQSAGEVSVRLHVTTSRPNADVFVRLCDVDPTGRSHNISDGIVRLTGAPDGGPVRRQVNVDLWPVTHRFRPGHRIRLQVAGGAHPRYARNTGTGDQSSEVLSPVDHELHHDSEHPCALVLPQRIQEERA